MNTAPAFRIRHQESRDLPALTDLVASAFAGDRTWGERRNLTEIAIPGMLAAGPSFDPEIALVAEDPKGRILGHALWYPYRMRLGGRRILSANLAPLSVDPAFKGRGIGGALIRASLPALVWKGVSLAFLCGHEAYYPRFGFKPGMFGEVGILPESADLRSIEASAKVNAAEGECLLRAPSPADEPALRALWEACLGDTDLALEPEPGFAAWMSWTPSTLSLVLERRGKVAAYARFGNESPAGAFGGVVPILAKKLRLFLAADAAAAASLLAALGRPIGKGEETADAKESPVREPLLVPLHPRSKAATRLFPGGFASVIERGGYAMALPLNGGPVEDAKAASDYCEALESRRREPGLLLFPSCFDLE